MSTSFCDIPFQSIKEPLKYINVKSRSIEVFMYFFEDKKSILKRTIVAEDMHNITFHAIL